MSEYVSIIANSLGAFAAIGAFFVALTALDKWKEQFRTTKRDDALTLLAESISGFYFNLQFYFEILQLKDEKLLKDYFQNKPKILEDQILEIQSYPQKIAALRVVIRLRFLKKEMHDTSKFLIEVEKLSGLLVLHDQLFNMEGSEEGIVQLIKKSIVDKKLKNLENFGNLYTKAEDEITHNIRKPIEN